MTVTSTNRWNWITRGLALALGLVFATSSAFAQFGTNFRNMGQPDVDSTQVDTIGEMLGFSEDQTDFAAELLQGYMAEVTTLGDDVRAIMDGARQEFRETRDPSVWQDLMSAMEPIQERKDEMTERFLEDLRLILEPEQDERWPEVERYHRRYASFSQNGLLSGETVDVIEAVRDLELPEGQMATITPILDQYALELDRALIQRDKVYKESMEGAMDLWRNQEFDEMEKRYDRARDEATKVRDINRRFARQVQIALDDQQAREWEREFKERSFPRVYRPTPTSAALTAAIAFDDLTPEQLDQVEAMRTDYSKRAGIMNDEIAQAIEEGEMNRGVQAMFGRGRGGESEEIRDAREKRRELDEEFMSKLRATLTDEQAAKLPEREDNRDWRERLPNRDRGGRSGGRAGGRNAPRGL